MNEIEKYHLMLRQYMGRFKDSFTEKIKEEISQLDMTPFEIKQFLQYQIKHLQGTSGPGMHFIREKIEKIHDGTGIIPLLIFHDKKNMKYSVFDDPLIAFIEPHPAHNTREKFLSYCNAVNELNQMRLDGVVGLEGNLKINNTRSKQSNPMEHLIECTMERKGIYKSQLNIEVTLADPETVRKIIKNPFGKHYYMVDIKPKPDRDIIAEVGERCISRIYSGHN